MYDHHSQSFNPFIKITSKTVPTSPQIIGSQPVDRQAHLAACLDKLMTDVQRSLEPKNRDKFTQNLTIVRHEYRQKL